MVRVQPLGQFLRTGQGREVAAVHLVGVGAEALAEAVAGGQKVATGELRCRGTRNRGKQESVVCGTLLRYKLNLNYD